MAGVGRGFCRWRLPGKAPACWFWRRFCRLPVFRGGYAPFRIFLGLLLLTAAALKAHQLATEPVLGSGLLDSRWFLIGVVALEAGLAFWLFLGVWARASWAVALAVFVLFACVSAYKGLAGEESCGCFGRVLVNPWFTGFLDVGLVASLLLFRPRQTQWPVGFGETAKGKRLALVWAVWLALSVPALLAMSNPSVAWLSDAGVVGAQGGLVVLEPAKWLGKRLPLLKYIDSPERLDAGRWLILLYHHDCPQCRAIVPHFPELARVLANGDKHRIALVEMPPYAEAHGEMLPVCSACTRSRLRDHYDWFAETPTAIELRDGAVVDVHARGRVVRAAPREEGSVR